jgi:hypothetical protein
MSMAQVEVLLHHVEPPPSALNIDSPACIGP